MVPGLGTLKESYDEEYEDQQQVRKAEAMQLLEQIKNNIAKNRSRDPDLLLN